MTDSAVEFADLHHAIAFYRYLQKNYLGFKEDPELLAPASLAEVRSFRLAASADAAISHFELKPPKALGRRGIGLDAQREDALLRLARAVLHIEREEDIPWKLLEPLREPIRRLLRGESADVALGLTKPAHRPSHFHRNVVLAIDLQQVLSWGHLNDFAVTAVSIWADVSKRTVNRSWRRFGKLIPTPSDLLKHDFLPSEPSEAE